MKSTISGRRDLYLLLCVIILFALGCSRPPTETQVARRGESYLSFSSDGAWCWFSDPRAIYYEGAHKRTYAGWVDSVGSIVVGYYDHDSGDIGTYVLHEKLERDDHDNPSFFIDDAGKLMVFYSRHATGNSPIFLARAKRPEDISQWEPVQTLRLNDTINYAALSNTYTYTNIVQLASEDNRMYLFWRGADFKPNFSVSADHGKTWGKGKILVEPERIYRDRRPYMKVASNDRDVIDFAFTDGHPRDEPTNSIYYARYKDGALYKASGEKIADWSALPMNPRQADVVYDARESKEKAWIWDVAEDKQGNPVVVYAKFPNDSTHVYYYGIYDGIRWNNYKLTDSGRWFPHTRAGAKEREPNYSGGIVLDHEDASVVYLSREKNGVFEIEKWSTNDQGKNWKVKDITSGSKSDNVRPFVIRGNPGDSLKVLWMNLERYIHYTNYQAEIKMSIANRESVAEDKHP
jgi:hypothetical protein